MNYNIKSFYSSTNDEIYTFYRQGWCLAQKCEPDAETTLEQISTADLGQMFLLFEEALVVRSSNSMIFFKKDPETLKWIEYHKIDDMRGTIYFIKGNIRIQITTESKVYFYIINKKTFMPELENVMMNFMNCSSLLFGARVRFGIAFKVSEPDFTIFTRKYYQNFKVCIDSNSFEGAVGVSLAPFKMYAMAHGLEIGIYD